jgi:transposase-like protein
LIWKWLHPEILFFLTDNNRFRADRHPIKKIFVDETLVRIYGRDYCFWVAYERNLDVCLIMDLSRERTILVCYMEIVYNALLHDLSVC